MFKRLLLLLAVAATTFLFACIPAGAEEFLSVRISRQTHRGKSYVFAELRGLDSRRLYEDEYFAIVEAIRERHPGAIILRIDPPVRQRVVSLPQVSCDEGN